MSDHPMTDAVTAAAADPVRDPARMAEIAALGLTEPEVDAVLQRTVDEAAARLDLPTALVSVVMDGAQWFAAHTGLSPWMAEARGTPVEWSFCANAVRSGDAFVVEDATTHPLVKDNPLVHIDNIRCYAGIPLVTSTGVTLGTLCVIGNEPRSFTDDEMETLRSLARTAMEHIESRRQA
ncbi:GAF domain-containing protein [Longimicrobium sp.]|uniref:GAF domain-containing protein n=1 Tax=Longimicrobium sp. TaxID=2029185 RepID=UPI002E377F1F|nr:GAF domain-containing protein [Longimicrobium sp.]HEX6041938.1 GAF domain-containing protein [Longimicrobium sp.]